MENMALGFFKNIEYDTTFCWVFSSGFFSIFRLSEEGVIIKDTARLTIRNPANIAKLQK